MNQRVGKALLLILATISAFFDAVLAILNATGIAAPLELILTAVAYGFLIVVFWINNVKIISYKQVQRIKKQSTSGGRIWGKVLSVIAEFIPYLDIFVPGFVLFTYFVYKDAKEEDEAKAKEDSQNAETSVTRTRRGARPGTEGNVRPSRRSQAVENRQNNNANEDNVLEFDSQRITRKKRKTPITVFGDLGEQGGGELRESKQGSKPIPGTGLDIVRRTREKEKDEQEKAA